MPYRKQRPTRALPRSSPPRRSRICGPWPPSGRRGSCRRRSIRKAFQVAEQRGGFLVDAVSPMEAARAIRAPVLLIHGADDRETPPAHSQRIFESARRPAPPAARAGRRAQPVAQRAGGVGGHRAVDGGVAGVGRSATGAGVRRDGYASQQCSRAASLRTRLSRLLAPVRGLRWISIEMRIREPAIQTAVLASSREHLLHDLAVHVGEPEVAALEAVGQLLVIDPHQVQDGGLQVVDRHRI